MNKAGIVLLLLTLLSSCQNESKKITTYYLIRHAEKERGPNAGNDPHLTEKGKDRADFWATYFMNKELDAVYSSNTKRTRETAAPTAEEFGLPISDYSTRNLYSKDFQDKTQGQNVLIVGHSNTTPAFVNKIIGRQRFTDINDDEYGTVYRVVINNGKSEVEKKLINNWDKF